VVAGRPLQSIRVKYILLVLGAAVGLAAAGVILLVRLRNEAVRSAGEFAVGNLRTVALNVDEIARNVAFVFTPLLTSPPFTDLATDLSYLNPVASYADLERMHRLEDTLRRSYLSNNYISSISYYEMTHGIAIMGRADLQKARDVDVRATRWFINAQAVSDRQWWTVSGGIGGAEPLLSSYRQVPLAGTGGAPRGLLSIDIRASVVQDILAKISLGQDGRAFVMDCLGNLVATVGDVDAAVAEQVMGALGTGSNEGGYRTVSLRTGPALAAMHSSSLAGLRFVAILSLRHVDTFAPIILTLLLYTYIALVIVIAAMALITYVSFYRPLTTLFLGMKQLAAGDFTVSLASPRKDEVGYIYDNFNRMVGDLKRLIDDNYLMQISRKDAHLKLVLSQLNEHFLYNTLDCIHWLARKHGVDEISRVVQSLSRFYSLSLSNGRDVVPVRDIVGIVDAYLDIQRVRRPDGFEYRCDADPAVLDVPVLKYLFQPLVENAVVHGLRDRAADGVVEVSFRLSGDMLRFEVTDNGGGMPAVKLAEIRAAIARDPADTDGAFALCNVSTQLRLFYGIADGLHIESSAGAGTRAWLDVPLTAGTRADA